MLNKIPLIFAILAVLAVSGCTMPWGPAVTAPAGYGLVISDFYSSMNEVTGCDRSVKIYFDVENKGGASISNGDAIGCIMGSNFKGNTEDQMWALDNADEICFKTNKKLDAAYPAENIPGGVNSFKWNVYSPWIQYPMTRTDTFTGRVFFKYESMVSTSVWIYKEDELIAAKQRGETIPSSLTVGKTVAPVDISIDTIQPIIASSVGDTFTIKVTVSNTGGGTVFKKEDAFNWNEDKSSVPSIDEKYLNEISIKIETPLDEGTSAQVGYCYKDLSNIELRKGQTVTIPCDIKLHEAITTKKSYPILLTAEYGYYVDQQVSITALGKKDESSIVCSKPGEVDTTAPTISFISPTPVNDETKNVNYFFVNASMSEDCISARLETNITGTFENYAMEKLLNTIWYLNNTDLSNGYYKYKVFATDTSGNVGASEQRGVTISA